MEQYSHRCGKAERYAYEESYCNYHAVEEIVDSVAYQIQIHKPLDAHPLINIGIVAVHVTVIPVYKPLKQKEHCEAEGQM